MSVKPLIAARKPKRRWFQYSLRSLFLLATVCAVVCGLVVHKLRVDQDRRKIRLEFRRLGGDARWDTAHWWSLDPTVGDFTPNDYFHLNRSWKGGGITDTDLRQLEPHLRGIKYLFLDGSDVTDESLELLERMPDLRLLYLGSTAVTDVGLHHLAHLPQLEELNLHAAGIPDRDISWLARACTRHDLKTKVVSKVTDESLKYIGRLHTVRQLGLGMTDVNGSGLIYLKSLPALEVLNLDSTLVMDKALGHLQSLPRLRVLDLSATCITDAGLEKLHGLKGLESLWLKGTNVSDAGAARLQEALPDCKIER